MTPWVSSETVTFAVWYVPITVMGTVSTVTGTVSQFLTCGIPVRNLTTVATLFTHHHVQLQECTLHSDIFGIHHEM